MNRKILERRIQLKKRGQSDYTSVVLQVSEPCFNGKLWECEWRCDIIHPATKTIFGEDFIGAWYYTLRFIEAFFLEMSKMGHSIRASDLAENGGFDFGLNV